MLDISLLQMKYVMEIYKAGSISKAAKNLYMNQPNLSRAIKELEKTLGIVIFIRTPKGIILSKEGKLFLEYAKSIFHKLEELEEQLRDQKENNVSFNISIPRATYITTHLPSLFRRFTVRLRLRSTIVKQIISML